MLWHLPQTSVQSHQMLRIAYNYAVHLLCRCKEEFWYTSIYVYHGRYGIQCLAGVEFEHFGCHEATIPFT